MVLRSGLHCVLGLMDLSLGSLDISLSGLFGSWIHRLMGLGSFSDLSSIYTCICTLRAIPQITLLVITA